MGGFQESSKNGFPMIGDTTLATHRVRYSAAYPTGRARLPAHQRGQAPWMPPPGGAVSLPLGVTPSYP